MESEASGSTVPPAPMPATAGPGTNGVHKCASCGSSDVSFDGSWLVCAYCHHRWNTAVIADELHLSEGIENLVGTSVLTGAKNIDVSRLVTVKCDGCGAVVTINSENTLQATCHWCRHSLSLNRPVDNGAIPDAILPFYIAREDAHNRMARYVARLTKFASKDFTRDFQRASIQPVYLPYLVVDGNVTVRLEGRGWVADNDWVAAPTADRDQEQQYVTAEFAVMREADLLVDDLVIEARSVHTRLYSAVSTTNIVNAIQPFDVEHAMRFNANYITDGVTFERRDTEVSGAMAEAANLFATIARGYVNQTLSTYTGGVRWEKERTAIKGSRWVSMLLPVWLYAFEERTPNGPMMHYIAVNGRTGETEGSVPVDRARVRRASLISGWAIGAIGAALVCSPVLLFSTTLSLAALSGDDNAIFFVVGSVLIDSGIVGIGIVFGKRASVWRRKRIDEAQRNPGARLMPEYETKYTPTRLERDDVVIGNFTHLGGPEIESRNDHRPQDRAEVSEHFLGELPPPISPDEAAASFVWNSGRGVKFDKHGRKRAGQRRSTAPPGIPPVPMAGFTSAWRWPLASGDRLGGKIS